MVQADRMLEELLAGSARFERLSHEPQVVLVGRPNAGKSTLLNTLAQKQRAVVSPVAGTTRDALSAEVMLPRGTIHLIDVAGIESTSAQDPIESKMQAHALRALESADVVVLVRDSLDPLPILDLPREPHLSVETKIDLKPSYPAQEDQSRAIPISALTGIGIDLLKSRLDLVCFGPTSGSCTLALNLRHVRAIDDARASLSRLLIQPDSPSIELAALELREALESLGNVLGKLTPDDLLGRIFSGFCIGK